MKTVFIHSPHLTFLATPAQGGQVTPTMAKARTQRKAEEIIHSLFPLQLLHSQLLIHSVYCTNTVISVAYCITVPTPINCCQNFCSISNYQVFWNLWNSFLLFNTIRNCQNFRLIELNLFLCLLRNINFCNGLTRNHMRWK